MCRYLSLLLFIISLYGNSNIIGKYLANDGMYSHVFNFYSTGTYQSEFFGEISRGDWVQDGKKVNLYSHGIYIESFYLSEESFTFGGLRFNKTKLSSNNHNQQESLIGRWVTPSSNYAPIRMHFYSSSNFSYTSQGETSWGDWTIGKKNRVTLSIDGRLWDGYLKENKLYIKNQTFGLQLLLIRE